MESDHRGKRHRLGSSQRTAPGGSTASAARTNREPPSAGDRPLPLAVSVCFTRRRSRRRVALPDSLWPVLVVSLVQIVGWPIIFFLSWHSSLQSPTSSFLGPAAWKREVWPSRRPATRMVIPLGTFYASLRRQASIRSRACEFAIFRFTNDIRGGRYTASGDSAPEKEGNHEILGYPHTARLQSLGVMLPCLEVQLPEVASSLDQERTSVGESPRRRWRSGSSSRRPPK